MIDSLTREGLLQSNSGENSWQYLKNYVWLQVVVGVAAVVFIIVLICICFFCRRKCRRYDYSAREEEVSLLKKWDIDRKAQIQAERGSMMLNCQFYLRNTGKYTVTCHFPDIGSRIERSWFLISDHSTSNTKDRLLTITPATKEYINSFNSGTKRMLRELFSVMQHPYILPVHELDIIPDQEFVIVTQTFQTAGSLKDLIYNAKPQEPWETKYKRKGRGLSTDLIQNYGRQILEALLFLRDLGFPSNGHVHSGNIFPVNRVCRLGGYENVIIGHVSRLSNYVKRCVRDNREATEVVCFGYLLFEMAAGFELDVSEPESHHLTNCGSDVAECLNYIFSNDSGTFPTVEELISHRFFSRIQTEKFDKQIKLSSQLKGFLKQVRKDALQSSRGARRKSRKKSENTPNTESSKSKKSKQKEILKTFPPPTRSHPIISSVPPPPPPPPSNMPTVRIAEPTKRTALLQSIRTGAQLKKVVTVDKSAPKI